MTRILSFFVWIWQALISFFVRAPRVTGVAEEEGMVFLPPNFPLNSSSPLASGPQGKKTILRIGEQSIVRGGINGESGKVLL